MILDEPQRHALAFVRAANRGGYQPTDEEVEEWCARPGPKKEVRRGSLIDNYLKATVVDFLSSEHILTYAAGAVVDPTETLVESLIRLRWLQRSVSAGRRLVVTDLGSALLRAEEATDPDDTDVLVLAAGDRMAYLSLIGRIAELESPLVVDPYLRVDQLAELMQYTGAGRFLIGKNLSNGQVAPMRMLVESEQADRPSELRQDPSGRLHDRYLMSEEAVYTFGTSMNSVGHRATTVLMPLTDVAAEAVRRDIEEIWSNANQLAPAHTNVKDQEAAETD